MPSSSDHCLLSIVLATHNRRALVLDTLARLTPQLPTGRDAEVIVVDNASTDGTSDAIARRFPEVTVIRRRDNCGSCSKSFGVAGARGEYIVFLDDDSCPRRGSLERMLAHFRADPQLAAAGFTVHLPGGARECAALPDVFVGCGVGLRADMLRQAGGLDAGFFMQAEEYDLCFRLTAAGHRVRVFSDLHVDHLKTPAARRSARTTYYDTRNNLIVAARYLPDPWARLYAQDWLQRYRWLAQRAGHRGACWRGAAAGLARWALQRRAHRDVRLDAAMMDRLFCISAIERRMRRLKRSGARCVALAELGKNVYPFVRAAWLCELHIPAIADDRFAARGRAYRGIPLVPTGALADLRFDAVVVASTAVVHAATAAAQLASRLSVPIHAWFTPPAAAENKSMSPTRSADKSPGIMSDEAPTAAFAGHAARP